RQIEMHY
ncbi:hypothetical protein ACTFIV_003202, partial [Dictyostelium citrinum]